MTNLALFVSCVALFGQLINAFYCLYNAIKEKDEPVWWVAFMGWITAFSLQLSIIITQ